MQLEELKALVHELQTQDNEITADPIFCVKQTRRIYGLDPLYVDEYCFIDEEGNEIDLEEDGLTEQEAEETDCITKVHYADELEIVNFHFTRKEADAYIAKYGYNHNKPFVCVENLRRCFGMIKLRDWLVSGEPVRVAEKNEKLSGAIQHMISRDFFECKYGKCESCNMLQGCVHENGIAYRVIKEAMED